MIQHPSVTDSTATVAYQDWLAAPHKRSIEVGGDLGIGHCSPWNDAAGIAAGVGCRSIPAIIGKPSFLNAKSSANQCVLTMYSAEVDRGVDECALTMCSAEVDTIEHPCFPSWVRYRHACCSGLKMQFLGWCPWSCCCCGMQAHFYSQR